jgi:hypothetical protein
MELKLFELPSAQAEGGVDKYRLEPKQFSSSRN